MIVALAGIGTALALFSVVKRQHEGFALGFVTTRVFEAGVIAVGVMSILSVVTLQQPGATGVEATSLVTLGGALVATYNWSFLLGQSLMPGLNALILGTLMYRSGLVPRWIPARAGSHRGPAPHHRNDRHAVRCRRAVLRGPSPRGSPDRDCGSSRLAST